MPKTAVSYNWAVAITPSDTVNIVPPGGAVLTDAIFVGGAGIVVAILQNDQAVNFTCVAGEILPIRAKRVNSGTTTATLMVALYQV